MIQQFRRNQPGIGVDIQMGSVQEVYRWVQEGRVDLCFASRQESVALDWIPMQDDELLAILPPDYDNGGRSAFPVEEFTGKEFLMPSMGFTLDIMRVLNRHGVTPLIRTTQVSDSVILSMVEHGLGVSMLSRLVLQGASGRAYRPCRWPRGPSASWAWPPVPAGSCAPWSGGSWTKRGK